MNQNMDSGITMCGTCLSTDRSILKLSNISNIYQVFETLMYGFADDGSSNTAADIDTAVCWECVALMKRFLKFKWQVHNAQEHLRALAVSRSQESQAHISILRSLSSLEKTIKLDYDVVFCNVSDPLEEHQVICVSTAQRVKIEEPDVVIDDINLDVTSHVLEEPEGLVLEDPVTSIASHIVVHMDNLMDDIDEEMLDLNTKNPQIPGLETVIFCEVVKNEEDLSDSSFILEYTSDAEMLDARETSRRTNPKPDEGKKELVTAPVLEEIKNRDCSNPGSRRRRGRRSTHPEPDSLDEHSQTPGLETVIFCEKVSTDEDLSDSSFILEYTSDADMLDESETSRHSNPQPDEGKKEKLVAATVLEEIKNRDCSIPGSRRRRGRRLTHPEPDSLDESNKASARQPSPISSSPKSKQCDVKINKTRKSLAKAEPLLPAKVLKCKKNSTPKRHPTRNNNVEFGSESDAGSDESDEEGISYPAITLPKGLRHTFYTDAETTNTADENEIEDSSSTSIPLEETDQPWRWYDFDWKRFPSALIPPESRREKFSQSHVGPKTPSVDPYDIFVEIWDRPIMEHIVRETNIYAQQVAKQKFYNNDLHPDSRINQWRDTNVDELYVYFSIMLAMGNVIKADLDEYWYTTADICCTPGFKAYMTRSRFEILNKCIHFNNNDDMSAEVDFSEAKLYKIKPLLSHLNEKFQSLYIPEQNIAIDESLLQWKNCLYMAQLIPNKVETGGIKSFEIYESQTGYLWRFEIFAPTRTPKKRENPLDGSTPSTVLRLVEGLENKGYTLWMDNYYNSPCLARRLKSLGFDCVGTLQTNRQFVPPAFNSLNKLNMRPGQVCGLTAGDVDILVFRDHNVIPMISTYHGNGRDSLGDAIKPTVILDYNIIMSGVDKKDQMLAMYPIERKRTKVWYKKLFRRLLNISVLNSYVIHQHHPNPLVHRNFRNSLIRSLLARHSCNSVVHAPPPRAFHFKKKVVDVTHRVALFPFEKQHRQRKSCVCCRKRVTSFCFGCTTAVCIEPCFVTLHS